MCPGSTKDMVVHQTIYCLVYLRFSINRKVWIDKLCQCQKMNYYCVALFISIIYAIFIWGSLCTIITKCVGILSCQEYTVKPVLKDHL